MLSQQRKLVEMWRRNDVSPVFGKSPPPPLQQASESPDDLREKMAVTASPHESLTSKIFFCKIMRSTVLLKKLNNRISSGSPTYRDFLYPILSKESQASLIRTYLAGKQLRSLLLWGSLRWFITAGLLGLLDITIWKFSIYNKMDNGDRLWFNSVLTDLIIVIGLAIASHRNAMTFNKMVVSLFA